ncbi:hypothetical protein SORBI_3005G221550 [Sorghum bicolor]|uniref:Uncharacterized protein n=1 Tax=Sorghum bicolor TaxID=4558 RepID=A0A1Z5RKR6_SORBI|nr:hypothetical protein SORBI_3005G221550 [Sorghum bicolor]
MYLLVFKIDTAISGSLGWSISESHLYVCVCVCSGPGPAPARQHIQAGVRACEALSLGSTAAAPLLLVLHGSTRSKSSNNKNMATAYYSGISRKDGLSAEVLSFGR